MITEPAETDVRRILTWQPNPLARNAERAPLVGMAFLVAREIIWLLGSRVVKSSE